MELTVTSVVIPMVDQDGIAVFKRKGQPPIAVDADRPVPRTTALEGVPFPAGAIHI